MREARCERFGLCIPAQRLAVGVTRKEAIVLGARILDHEPRRVGVADEIVEVDLIGAEQLMDQSADQQPVGSRFDAEPFVGNGVVARADRIDGDDLGAALLELAKRDLDGVGAVVLGDAEEQEIFRVVPVWLAEFPERAAERVEAAGGHVDGAEAAMGCKIRRAELHRPPSRERLRLIAACEEGELLGVGPADLGQPTRSAVASASSQPISTNSPEPRGPTRFSGARSRDGA